MNHPIVSRHLAEGDPFLALANIFLGMMALVALHCLSTGIRARSRNFLLLGSFFIGGFINAVSNLYFRFWIPTVEPYIGSWITLSAFVLFVESYLDLPGSKARIRVGILFLAFGVAGFVVSVLVTVLEMRFYGSIIVVMDVLATTLILTLYVFLLFHSVKGSGRARALLAFETIMVVGAVSAMGIFKTAIRGLNGIPDSLIDGNFLFLIGMTVNGFLFVYLLTEELVGMRVRTELDHARINFIMNVSHELKTPLTIIGGMIHQLKEGRWGDSIKENINHLNVVERNSRKLLKEITNLLHLSDLEYRDRSFQTRATDISNTLEGICREFRGAAEQCGLDFTVEIAPDLGTDTDPVLFENAVLNLLSNAIKYTPPGGKVKLSAVESVEEICVCVSDTGSGIPEDEHEKVFQRFYRSPAARKTAETGKGIGLALVKETVTRSGGRMELKSEPGIGTRVSLVFPRGTGRVGLVHTERSAEPARSEHESQATPAKRSNAGLVLLVEDNQELIAYLRSELDRVFTVASVTNGAEALEWLGSHTPDLIISDVMMPEVDGYELFDRLRADKNSVAIPFLFLTARSSADEKLTALRNGAVDYIEKPFFAEELIAKARSIVATTNEVRSGFQRELKTSLISFIDSFPADHSGNPATDSDLLFAQACRTAKLTPREREISLLLRKGKSDKEIADHLGLSTKTVGNYNTSLFRKLNVAGRMEIVAFGRD